MRQSELATLFDYMYWANSRILTTAARLTDALSDYRNVAALADHWKRDEAEMRAWVASLDNDSLARTPDDPRAHFPLWYYLLHMVTHSQQHRAESAQLLTQLGRSPGDIDFLDYADSARAAR